MAERLGRDLADRGIVVTSDMARGIDSCAHKGALSSTGGATIGVLGCGIDVVYPKENKKIFAVMEQRGAIITEFPMGTFPAPQNFPIRNRVIAGIALGGCSCRGRAVLWISNHCAACDGIWPRSLRCPRQRDPAHQLRTEPAD
jgi:hypothetical protein